MKKKIKFEKNLYNVYIKCNIIIKSKISYIDFFRTEATHLLRVLLSEYFFFFFQTKIALSEYRIKRISY